jgi:hypothetical protein
MFYCPHDPGLAAYFVPDHRAPEANPLPSRGEACLALACLLFTFLLLAAL